MQASEFGAAATATTSTAKGQCDLWGTPRVCQDEPSFVTVTSSKEKKKTGENETECFFPG